MEVRSVEAVVRALNDAGAEYLIVGGLAVNAHGFVRLTRDVDLVLRLGSENADRGLRRAPGHRLPDVGSRRTGGVCRRRHAGTLARRERG